MSLNYCINKACKKGSSLHYSLCSLPSEQRKALICIQAFYREILDCLFDCSDTAITRVRLQFWRDELDLAYQGSPAHPVMQLLSCVLNTISLNKKLFFTIINGMESYLNHPLFEKPSDVFHFLAKTAGARELLNLQVLGEFPGCEQFAYQLGAGLELVHQLRNLKLYLNKGLLFFAQHALNASACKPDYFLEKKPPDAVFNFLTTQFEQARHYLLTAKEIAQQHKATQRVNLMRIQLSLALLNELEKSRLPVLKAYIRLNPIRKLWITWRLG